MSRLLRHSRLPTALVLLLAFALQACSNTVQNGAIYYPDAGKKDASGLFGDIKYGDGGGPAPGEDGSEAPDGGGEAVVKRQIILLLADSKLFMAPNGSESIKPIGVQVIDYAVGGPAAGVPVFWEITANQGPNAPGAGAFDNQNVFTDDGGKAQNVFRANKTPLNNYKIKVSCDGAEPVEFEIVVSDNPKGSIRVKMAYDNLVPLGPVSIRLQNAPFTCSSFKPVKPPDVSLKSITAGLSDQPQFDELPADKKYAVLAIAKDANNHLAAAGCADGVLVNNQEVTEVTVTLTTLPLLASGVYDMVNHFDFTGAIPGKLGQILDTAVQIFYDPGAFIIEQVKNLVKQLLPGIIVDTVFSLFEKQLAKVVTDWLLNKSPPWLQKFFNMGQEVLQIVKNLEMVGDLKIFKVGNDFFVKGEIAFTGVNLYWKSFYGCKPNSPPECGKWALDLKNASKDPNFPLELLTGDFTGNVSERVKLNIDSGTIKLNYGKLILFVITNLVLKSITGENTFIGAMQKLVNCQGIATGIGNSILGKLGLSAKTVEDVCNSAVALLVLPLENLLGGLTFDSKLALNGKCLLQDDDDDLKVDKLVDGVWVGTIVTGTPGKPFKGDFTANRKPGL